MKRASEPHPALAEPHPPLADPLPAPAVIATPAALEAIARLVAARGPIMFFQSGGCCDGSLPMCFADGELVVGEHDVLLGRLGGAPFWIDHRQYEKWKHVQLVLDVAEGEPEGFSLAAGPDRHFITRSGICSPPPGGAP